MSDNIVNRLRFDASRIELGFSKGIAKNMEEAADTIERLRATQPAAPVETLLWCCHVRGPDDVYAAPDYETALNWSDTLNQTNWGKTGTLRVKSPTSWDGCLVKAAPALWPYSRDSHAEDLPKSIAGFAPVNPKDFDRNLSLPKGQFSSSDGGVAMLHAGIEGTAKSGSRCSSLSQRHEAGVATGPSEADLAPIIDALEGRFFHLSGHIGVMSKNDAGDIAIALWRAGLVASTSPVSSKERHTTNQGEEK